MNIPQKRFARGNKQAQEAHKPSNAYASSDRIESVEFYNCDGEILNPPVHYSRGHVESLEERILRVNKEYVQKDAVMKTALAKANARLAETERLRQERIATAHFEAEQRRQGKSALRKAKEEDDAKRRRKASRSNFPLDEKEQQRKDSLSKEYDEWVAIRKRESEERAQQERQRKIDAANAERKAALLHNVIAFNTDEVRSWHPTRPTPAIVAARGMAKLGYSVVVVNADHVYPGNGRTEPIKVNFTGKDKKISGEIYTISYSGESSAFRLLMKTLAKDFDYVLLHTHDHWVEEAKFIQSAAARVIFDNEENLTDQKKYISHEDYSELAKKSYLIFCATKPAILWMDERGVPHAGSPDTYSNMLISTSAIERPKLSKTSDNIQIPLIASCHQGVDEVKFAQAVLGIGDPLDFFVTYKHRKMSLLLQRLFQSGVTTGAVGGGSLGLSFLTAAVSAPAVVPSAFGFVGAGVIGIGVSAMHRYKTGKINSKKAHQDDIYDSPSPVNFPATALPLGETRNEITGGSTRIANTTWTRAQESYIDIKARWVEYELDVFKTLDAPLMVDYSCPETASLVRALNHATNALNVAQESNDTLHAASTKKDFFDAVTDLEVAFKVAEDNALNKGIGYLGETEQTKVTRARGLMAMAKDNAASDSERQVAYEQALKNLKGIIRITDKAHQRLIDSAGVRKALEA
jgi:hypothetical protein